MIYSRTLWICREIWGSDSPMPTTIEAKAREYDYWRLKEPFVTMPSARAVLTQCRRQRGKELGITFVGPPSPVMSVLGDKIAANILAQTAGVPSIPWSGDGLTAELTEEGTIPDETFKKGCVSSVDEAVACAERGEKNPH